MLLLGGISQIFKFKYFLLTYLDDIQQECPLKRTVLPKPKRQSPIAIGKGGIVPKNFSPLQFHNYDVEFRAAVENTGKLVRILISNEVESKEGDESPSELLPLPALSGGPLEAQYLLDSIHFHWDAEHILEGYRYPLEAHFIHYRSDLDRRKAPKFDKGIVIVSVMYEVTKCTCAVFEEISNSMQEIASDINCTSELENRLCLRTLLPKHINSYFTYEGSMTDPDYEEGVIWIIFDEPSRIERKQLQKLTRVLGEDNRPLQKNWRSVQELDGREIYYSGGIFARIRKSLRNYMRDKSEKPPEEETRVKVEEECD